LRVLFIYSIQDAPTPDKPLRVNDQIQLGISYISSVLQQAGHQTDVLVMTRDTKLTVVDEWLERFQPGIVGFTAMSSEFEFIRKLGGYVKQICPNLYTAVGGSHTTISPKESYLDTFDALCVGEGEQASLELVEMLATGARPGGIANFWFRRDEGVEKNACRPYIEDLDSIPWPDREMWRKWIVRPQSRNFLLVGRGCPYPCTYCLHHAVSDLAEGRYVRFRDPAAIVKEVDHLARECGAREIYLETETFNIHRKWIQQLCEQLAGWNAERAEPVSFGANLRIIKNKTYDDILEPMARANFRYVNIGLESGSDRVRREILKRSYSNEDVIRTVETVRKNGIEVTFQNMVGMPGETYEDFLETVELNRRCQPDWHHLSIFEPYPGIQLYEKCKEMGLLEEEFDDEMIRYKAVLDLPGFSRAQIRYAYQWFDYMVYKGRRPWVMRMLSVLARKAKGRRGPNYLYRRFMTSRVGWSMRQLWDGNARYPVGAPTGPSHQ